VAVRFPLKLCVGSARTSKLNRWTDVFLCRALGPKASSRRRALQVCRTSGAIFACIFLGGCLALLVATRCCAAFVFLGELAVSAGFPLGDPLSPIALFAALAMVPIIAVSTFSLLPPLLVPPVVPRALLLPNNFSSPEVLCEWVFNRAFDQR